MNNASTQKLCADFPRLYRGHGNSRSAMQFGFEYGDGWFDLVYRLSAEIEAEAKKLGLDPDSDAWPCALQVKEKFGTLKFYCDTGAKTPAEGLAPEQAGNILSFRPWPSLKTIGALIVNAERQSATICEDCGRAGKLRRDGWWRTLCDECDIKRMNETNK